MFVHRLQISFDGLDEERRRLLKGIASFGGSLPFEQTTGRYELNGLDRLGEMVKGYRPQIHGDDPFVQLGSVGELP